MTSPLPAGIPGVLSLYQREPTTLSYHDSDPSQPHTLLFVPGLTDTLCSVPYLPLLPPLLHAHGFSLVQPLLTSNMSGWGLSTLSGDVDEIRACLVHLSSLPSKRGGKVILMGHSTGCQDVVTFLLDQERVRHTGVVAAVLQAPVSDREDYEKRYSDLAPHVRVQWDAKLEQARQMVNQGKGHEVLPRLDLVPAASESPQLGNSHAALNPAFTAYRYTSLYDVGGDDDLFSWSLSDEQLTDPSPQAKTIGRALHNLVNANQLSNTTRLLALQSQNDEYVHPPIHPEKIVQRWNNLFSSEGGFKAVSIEGANHKVDQQKAQVRLVELLHGLIEGL
ncbi:hypothetical protein ACQY0O_002278 [Thecaphora frezii]